MFVDVGRQASSGRAWLAPGLLVTVLLTMTATVAQAEVGAPVRPGAGLSLPSGGGSTSVTFLGRPLGGTVPFAGGVVRITPNAAESSGRFSLGSRQRLSIAAPGCRLVASNIRLIGGKPNWTLHGRIAGRDLALAGGRSLGAMSLSARKTPAGLTAGFALRLSRAAVQRLRHAGCEHPATGQLGTARFGTTLFGTVIFPRGGLEFAEQPGVNSAPGSAWVTATQPGITPTSAVASIRHRGAIATVRANPPTGSGQVAWSNPIVAFTPSGGALSVQVGDSRMAIGDWTRASEQVQRVGSDSRIRLTVRVYATAAAALNASLHLADPLAAGDPVVALEVFARGIRRPPS